MVMATEMKQHFEHLAKFDNSFNKRHATPVYDHDNLSTVCITSFFFITFYLLKIDSRNFCVLAK